MMIPEWTSDEIGTVRRLARKGILADTIAETIRWPGDVGALRRRAKRYGISVPVEAKQGRAHDGTSTLSLPQSVRGRW